MKKQFIKAESVNFGTLYFSPCGKLFFATSSVGELECSSLTPVDGYIKCRWSFEGVLVRADARVAVKSVTECECMYKRVAVEVAPELGGFSFNKRVFRTFSRVDYECVSECEPECNFDLDDDECECLDEVAEYSDEELIGLA